VPRTRGNEGVPRLKLGAFTHLDVASVPWEIHSAVQPDCDREWHIERAAFALQGVARHGFPESVRPWAREARRQLLAGNLEGCLGICQELTAEEPWPSGTEIEAMT
jgi:hypothetical protein